MTQRFKPDEEVESVSKGSNYETLYAFPICCTLTAGRVEGKGIDPSPSSLSDVFAPRPPPEPRPGGRAGEHHSTPLPGRGLGLVQNQRNGNGT